jgi:hypothetical protein
LLLVIALVIGHWLLRLSIVAIATTACTAPPRPNMNDLAERYVRLVLNVGQHDPRTAGAFSAVQAEVEKLTYAGNEAARRYLNGEIDRAAAAAWLETWALMPKDRAEQRTKFFDQYRSYVINYNLGQDLVRAYLDRQGGTPDKPDVRWAEFGTLLASPRLPSGLSPRQ